MITFFSGCAGLFTSVFNAVCEIDYFLFLFEFLAVLVSASLFIAMSKSAKKL